MALKFSTEINKLKRQFPGLVKIDTSMVSVLEPQDSPAEVLPPPRTRKFPITYDSPADTPCPVCGSVIRWENTNNHLSCAGCCPNTNPEAVWQWYRIENGKLDPIDDPTVTKSDAKKE